MKQKPRIVATPERTDGMKWMIKFGWTSRASADRQLARLKLVVGDTRGPVLRGAAVDKTTDMACPLLWTRTLPDAVEIASAFPLVA